MACNSSLFHSSLIIVHVLKVVLDESIDEFYQLALENFTLRKCGKCINWFINHNFACSELTSVSRSSEIIDN